MTLDWRREGGSDVRLTSGGVTLAWRSGVGGGRDVILAVGGVTLAWRGWGCDVSLEGRGGSDVSLGGGGGRGDISLEGRGRGE